MVRMPAAAHNLGERVPAMLLDRRANDSSKQAVPRSLPIS